MISDSALLTLKYTAGGIAGVYGIYATLTDFHKEKNGRKILSRAGYLGIVLLLLATALNMTTDVYKDQRDSRQAQEQIKKEGEVSSALTAQLQTSTVTSRQLGNVSDKLTEALNKLSTTSNTLEKNARTTSAVLHEAERANDPISDKMTAEINFEIPGDQEATKAYIARMKSKPGDVELPGGAKGHFMDDVEGYPNVNNEGEGVLSAFAHMPFFDVTFTKPSLPHERLTLKAGCGQKRIWFVPASGDAPEHLSFRCYTKELIKWVDSPAYRSYDDLGGAIATVVLDPDVVMPPHTYPNEQGRWSGIKFLIANVIIHIPGSRFILLEDFNDVGWKLDQQYGTWVSTFQTKVPRMTRK